MIKISAFADEAGASLDEQITALKRNGISLIEIRNVDGVNILNIDNETATEIYKKLSDNNIEVWSIGSPIGKVNIDEDFDKYLESFTHILNLAEIMHCKRVRMFSFFNAYEKGKEVVEKISEMVKLAKERGVTLCHENEKEIFGDVADRVTYILNNVDGLKCIFDPANFIQCDEDINYAITQLKDRIEYYHIKDIIKESGEIVPAGYGDGEISKLITTADGKDKVFTIEPHLRIFDGYKVIDNSELKNKTVFKNSTESFDCAVNSFKKLLKENGYSEKNINREEKVWIK